MGEYELRPLATLEECRACTALQEEVWGGNFLERVPAALLMVVNRIGGLAAGAFGPSGELDAFVFGITGIQDGAPVHWSDMLAVRPGLRDRGLGTRLKRYQREVLLDRGVRRMHWTYDPLQGRNAFINFGKLGIVCREYVPDMYGETDSPLHRGIGTDRLVATWDMDSHRVVSRMAGANRSPHFEAVAACPRVMTVMEEGPLPQPGEPVLALEGERLLLPIPEDLNLVMEKDLPLAARWRMAIRESLMHYLGSGYELKEFLRGAGVSWYLLERAGA